MANSIIYFNIFCNDSFSLYKLNINNLVRLQLSNKQDLHKYVSNFAKLHQLSLKDVDFWLSEILVNGAERRITSWQKLGKSFLA